MKSILVILISCLMVFATACSTKTTTDKSAAVEESKPEETSTPAASATPTGDAYKITVLKGDLPSPRKEMRGSIDGVDIVINYGSPSVKDRQVLDGLIPYGKVWRAGANEATTIEVSKDVMIGGKKLPAGKYGLFTLNTEGSAEVIFNSVHEQWGAYEYDKSKDVLRITVTPEMSDNSAETMDFMIEDNEVSLVWEKVVIPFTVTAG